MNVTFTTKERHLIDPSEAFVYGINERETEGKRNGNSDKAQVNKTIKRTSAGGSSRVQSNSQ